MRQSPEEKLESSLARAGITSCDRILDQQTLRQPAAHLALRYLISRMAREITNGRHDPYYVHLQGANDSDLHFQVQGRMLTEHALPGQPDEIGLIRRAVKKVLTPASPKAGNLIRQAQNLGVRFFDFSINGEERFEAANARLKRIEPCPQPPYLRRTLAKFECATGNADLDLVMWSKMMSDNDTSTLAPVFVFPDSLVGRRLVAVPEKECTASKTLDEIIRGIRKQLRKRFSEKEMQRLGL